MVDTLKIYVLGSPILQFEERPLTADLISLKGQALLVYLAVTQRAHSRTSLAGLLWGDMPEESARANLRITLSKLRKLLPETILHTTRLDVGLENFWLDAAEFERRFEIGDWGLEIQPISNLQSPIDLYRGDFLTGFDIPNAPEFETWVVGVREQLRQTAVSHLYQLVETAVHTQQAPSGIQAARQLLTIEPWHEETHRQLMYLLAADGQRSAALTQYETCRRLLADELGVEPSSETTAFYQQILDDKVTKFHPVTLSPGHPVTLSPANNLPTQFTPFVGRRQELQKLTHLLQDGRSRLITILGEGGVGKTRLAAAAAEALLPHFSHGIWFVSLAGAENAPAGDAEDSVASAIAATLGLNFAPGEPPKQQLANYLRQRHALLILDNFEPLLAAAGLLPNLLATAPRLAILATSREPIRVQAERIFRLEGLAVPEEADWETAVATDSLQLFADRAERATGRNLLTPDNLPQMVTLCRFVNGLPLGIELMADWTRWLSLEAIATDLQTNLLHLAHTAQDVPERHRSLQAVFHYSWQMLTPDERNTLAQLSIFQGSFQLDGVRAVANSQPAALFALIDKSLVQHHGGDFYHLHELLRTFAHSKLAEQAIDTYALQDRHAHHYLARMSQRTALFFGPEPQIALHQTQAEAENLAVAWQWAVARPLPDDLLPAIPALGAYWNYAGLFREGDALLQAARHRLGDWPQLQAALAAEHATLLFELTRLEEMREAATVCITLSQQLEDKELEANGRLRLGQYFWRAGNATAAAQELAQAQQLAQHLELPHLEGQICRSLAANAWRLGEMAQAWAWAEQSRQLHQQTSDSRNLNRSLFFLAMLASEQQKHADVRAYLEPVLASARQLGDRPVEIRAISLLGRTAVAEGHFEQALDLLERELKLATESGQQWQIGATLSNQGDIWLKLGQFSRATACYDQSLALFRQLGTRQAQSNVLAYRGLLAAMQGDFSNGRAHCEEALQLAQVENALRETALARTFLGYNLLGAHAWIEAQTAFEIAGVDWTRLGDHIRQMEAAAGEAQSRMAQQQPEAAVKILTPVCTYLENHSIDGGTDPVQLFIACYQVMRQQGATAVVWLQRGEQWLQEKAARITDTQLRHSFLHQIPSHRLLLQLLASDSL